eukprot:COSAG05_NODE_1879_length_3911_cov_4.160283_1_plen_79_part_00
MFFIIFVGCGQAFNMSFGPYLETYADMSVSMMSLFRALLGEFEYLHVPCILQTRSGMPSLLIELSSTTGICPTICLIF